MTLKQIVYNIQNLIEKGHQSDDHKLSDTQVAFMVDYMRSYLLEQQRAQDNKKLYDRDIAQLITPIPMKVVDAAKACGFKTDCKILESEIEIPRYSKIFTVKTLAGHPIERTQYSKTYWVRYNRFTSEEPRWFILNNRLYIMNLTKEMFVEIYGIFAHPTKVLMTNQELCIQCGNTDCVEDYMDQEYPIPEELVFNMINLLRSNELNIFLTVPEDTDNDATQE